MNKLKVDNNKLKLKDEIINIEYLINKVDLEIDGNVSIYDFNSNDDLELNIKINKNGNLKYYMYSKNSFDKKIINIDNYDKTALVFNYSFICSEDCKVEINNNLLENQINSNIKVRAVAKKDSNIIISSNGYVKKGTKESEFNEDLRGLNIDDGMVKVYPNMFIDTNDVVANHNSTIGNIDKDYLFYLNSKGINNRDSKKLIIDGFINSILDEEMKKEI